MVGLSSFDNYGMNGFFVLPSLPGGLVTFVLKQKSPKVQDDNDPSAHRASTRLGVLVWPALVPGLLGVRGD